MSQRPRLRGVQTTGDRPEAILGGTERRLFIPQETGQHGYILAGRPLAAVTTVIGTVLRAPQLEEWFKRMGMQADDIRDEAAAFGKTVHAALTAHATGANLIPLDMPEDWRLTVEAGMRWLEQNVEEVYAAEEPICSPKYGYAGRPDLYCRRLGRRGPAIVDFKTTKDVYWSHRFQLAAYRQAAVETYGDKAAERIVLLLSKDQPGRVTPHMLTEHTRDFAGWSYCLGLYQIMKGGH